MLRLAAVHGVRAAGHVDGGVREGLVHRDPGVAEAADALLVAQRLPHRLAEHDRDVLDRVVGVDVDVAGGAHGRGRTQPCSPNARRACGRRTARRWRSRPVPVPSRSISTTTDDSLVIRSTRPTRLTDDLLTTPPRNASFSSGRADGHPQVLRDADVPDEHAAVQIGLPGARVASSNRPNRTKLASLGTTSKPSAANASTTRSRSARSRRTEPSVCVGVRAATPAPRPG